VGGARVNVLAVVVSCGACTSVGLTARHTAFLLRAGLAGIGDGPLLDANDEPVPMGVVPTLDPLEVGGDRVQRLGLSALDDALVGIGGLPPETRVKAVVGIDRHLADARTDGPRRVESLHAAVAHRLRSTVPGAPDAVVEVVAQGEIGAALRMAELCDELTRGEIDVVFVGGAHSDYDPAILRVLSQEGRLFGPEETHGILPGECAAFVALTTSAFARRRGAPEQARLHAVGLAVDELRPENDEPAFAAVGLTSAVRTAVTALGDARAGWLLTDMTAEAHRVHEWQAMFVRTQRHWCEPHWVDAPAQKLGRLGASALPLHVALAATAWRHGFAPHGIAVSMVGSDEGERAATLWSGVGPSQSQVSDASYR
jgi:3-oxoacyl-[acyl-carrier-protein] synthase-1